MGFKKQFIVLILLFLAGCGHMQSGRHVKVNGSLELLSAHYGVSVKEIKAANPGKSFHDGEVIFIPMPIGFASKWQKQKIKYAQLTGDYAWPVPSHYKISSTFGYRGRRHHDGIDIPAPRGTTIVAFNSGKVIFAGRMGSYGLVTIIAHENNVHSVYAHASKLAVSKGDIVDKGEEIARVGNTGRSTGPHLHFEIRQDNKIVDPLAFIPSFSSLAKN